MLIYKLLDHKPTHSGDPTDKDLSTMMNRCLGIKVAEWSMVGNDGTPKQGNFVSEVHALAGFESASGERKEFVSAPTPVHSRMAKVPDDLSDIPF